MYDIRRQILHSFHAKVWLLSLQNRSIERRISSADSSRVLLLDPQSVGTVAPEFFYNPYFQVERR